MLKALLKGKNADPDSRAKTVEREAAGKTGSKYLEALINQSRRMTTLKFVCGVLAVLLMWSMWTTYQTATNIPVRLISYQHATMQGVAEVGPYGSSNADYLTLIALTDVKLLTDYTPRNVTIQYGRFLNRLDSRLYASESTKLRNDALEKQSKPYSQTFHVQNLAMIGTNKIEIHGTTAFYEGDLRLEEKTDRYFLIYNWVGGVPMIATFIKDNGSERDRIDIENAKRVVGHPNPTYMPSIPEEPANITSPVGVQGDAPPPGALSYDKPYGWKPPERLLGARPENQNPNTPQPEVQVPPTLPPSAPVPPPDAPLGDGAAAPPASATDGGQP